MFLFFPTCKMQNIRNPFKNSVCNEQKNAPKLDICTISWTAPHREPRGQLMDALGNRYQALDGAVKKPGPEAVPPPLDPAWDGPSHRGNVDQGSRNLLEETDRGKNSRLCVPAG